ncbi:GDYXXLXY domain-containing protein [Labrenzia sp. PHM005]|uniref:GDYXXLXY domain-containing protein n=1 Tax=Labrenzia sp. PHM005 TaxID=2590016 RepID=UPI0011406257|nr:GDYXXLXY domain-containing protein [Labrenzia sp. PHM005]QDG78594.1 GDYXXLXY domain-containing protein [Labrenzia sp. PHM005]
MSTTETLEKPAPPLSFLPPYVKWGLLALIQLALISVPLIDRLQVQMSGQEVKLELIPVDPRDLLRGDYVIINLAISRLAADLPGADGLEEGDTVYVTLEPGENGLMAATSVSKDEDTSDLVRIAGKVQSATGEEIRVDYGIDAFFLPEGEGLVIERLDRERVQLVVAVTDDGRSLPLRLLVDGKPFKSDAAF